VLSSKDPTLGWGASGGVYRSPELRLLGQGSEFIVVWDSTRPYESKRISSDVLLEIVRY